MNGFDWRYINKLVFHACMYSNAPVRMFAGVFRRACARVCLCVFMRARLRPHSARCVCGAVCAVGVGCVPLTDTYAVRQVTSEAVMA